MELTAAANILIHLAMLIPVGLVIALAVVAYKEMASEAK